MTSNVEKALELLEQLNLKYEQTQDEYTAEKIIKLVNKEINDSLSYHNFMYHYEEKILNKYGIFSFLFKSSIEKELNRSPFRVYKELQKKKDEISKNIESKRLEEKYSLDAKSSTEIQKEKEKTEKLVFDSVESYLNSAARRVLLTDEAIKDFLNQAILSKESYHSLLNLASYNESNARSVLALSGIYKKNDTPIVGMTDECLLNLSNKFFDNKIKEPSVVEIMNLNERAEHFSILNEILNERIRQVTDLGYHTEHDDVHTDGSIADAAAYYASTSDDYFWPWHEDYNKKENKTRREQLVIAMALLLAEIERIDRTKNN